MTGSRPDSLAIQATPEGLLLPIRVRPQARKAAITGYHAGELKVQVTQPPEKGKANIAVADLLAARLGMKRAQVVLQSGQTSSRKKFLIRDIPLAELRDRIAQCVTDDASS